MTHNIYVCIEHHKTWHGVRGLGMHCAKWHNGVSYYQCSAIRDIGECYMSRMYHGCNVGYSANSSSKDEIDQAEKVQAKPI